MEQGNQGDDDGSFICVEMFIHDHLILDYYFFWISLILTDIIIQVSGGQSG